MCETVDEFWMATIVKPSKLERHLSLSEEDEAQVRLTDGIDCCVGLGVYCDHVKNKS